MINLFFVKNSLVYWALATSFCIRPKGRKKLVIINGVLAIIMPSRFVAAWRRFAIG